MKLAYKIAFPDDLIDTYNFLQKELNRVLSSEDMRTSILSIDNELHPGKYWPLLRDLIGQDTQYKWKTEKRFPSPS